MTMGDPPVVQPGEGESPFEGRSSELSYSQDRAALFSTGIGLARLALQDGRAADALECLDDVCHRALLMQREYLIGLGRAPADVDRFLGADGRMKTSHSNRYVVAVTRIFLGFTADVTWYPTGCAIGLRGPIFWRPTSCWVKRRADRYVARRLRRHGREANAERYEVIQ